MPRKIRAPKTTVLVVAEGYCDKAFVDYLKTLYIVRNCGVTVKVKNARGKGSNNVVNHAICIREGYDIKVAFYDNDVELHTDIRRKAGRKRIRLIESSPCLEGLLLKILGRNVPHNSPECKSTFLNKLEGKDPTNLESYSIITKNILDEKRHAIPELDDLLKALEGN